MPMDRHHELPTIQTARLVLRPLDLSDISAAFRMLNDPENLHHTSFLPPKTLAATEKWLVDVLHSPLSFYFGVCLSQLPPPSDFTSSPLPLPLPLPLIGLCGGVRTPEFSYTIDHPHTGRGYATEALAASVAAYWRMYPEGMPAIKADAERCQLVCVINVGNEASRRVVGKAGFEFVRREDEVREDGEVFEVEVWRARGSGLSGGSGPRLNYGGD